jgi:hypothetical protein
VGALESNGLVQTGWELLACKKLVAEDRKKLISIADKTVHFANKRVAHSVPDVPVSTTFNDLDDAIDAVERITEKYTQLFFSKRLRELEPLHLAGKDNGLYGYALQLSKNPGLLDEMKKRKTFERMG